MDTDDLDEDDLDIDEDSSDDDDDAGVAEPAQTLGGPLLNFHLQCSLGGASRHLARTCSQVHFRLAVL